MQVALTSQRSQCWPVTPVLQKHWPVRGWHESVPQGEQLHSAREKHTQLHTEEPSQPPTNLPPNRESYFLLIYHSQSKDRASLLLDLLLPATYSPTSCPGQIPFCELRFGRCSSEGDERCWERAVYTSPEGAPAPLLQELLGARPFQPGYGLAARIRGWIGGYGVVMLEGQVFGVGLFFFFLLSSLEDACNVCNQAGDSLGRHTARLRC